DTALFLRHLSPCGLVPMARRGRSAPLKPMRSTPDLAFLVRVLASVDLLPNLIQDFASLSMRPRTLGSLMNEEGGTRAFGSRAARWRESIPRPLCSLHLKQFLAQLSQLGDSPRAGSCMARVVTPVTRLGRMCDSENAHRYWWNVSAANQQM